PTTHGALQAHLLHQPRDGAARDRVVFALQLLPDLLGPVHLLVLRPHAANLPAPVFILATTRGPTVGIALDRLVQKVRGWSDRQLRADRLDSIGTTVLVDEPHHHFGRRSSFAWAKYADALRRISLARFSSTFSRSSCFNPGAFIGREARTVPGVSL